jgi:hypothetical protein
MAARFQVYESREIALAPGDWIRITQNGFTKDKQRLNNSSQSKGVDCVFVAESSESFRAADREQFYVSVNRFKKTLTIYTDDKSQLLEAVRKSSHRLSALDLAAKEISETVGEAETKEPVLPEANQQRKTPKIQRPVWSRKPHVRMVHSKG